MARRVVLHVVTCHFGATECKHRSLTLAYVLFGVATAALAVTDARGYHNVAQSHRYTMSSAGRIAEVRNLGDGLTYSVLIFCRA